MSLSVVRDPIVGQWVVDRLGHEGLRSTADLGPYHAIGIVKDGKAICGVVFNWYRQLDHGNDMRVIIVSEDPSWCRPGILSELFRYPFESANCVRLTAVIREGNAKSIKLCQGLGFRREGMLRKGWNGKTNAVLFGMLKSECKWLRRSERKAHNGQEVGFSAAPRRSGRHDRGSDSGQYASGH